MINMKKIEQKQRVQKCGLDAESYRQVKVKFSLRQEIV